jgi:iron complex transport system substrate-binding protein
LRADARFWLLLGLPLLGLLGVIAAVNLGAPKLGPHRIDRSVGHRIVSLAPSITEILFHIGAGDLVVGVTSHCDYPAEVTTRAKVGGYNTPNLELILAAKPDLVLVPQEGANRGVYDKLEELGVAVEAIAVTRLADVPSAVREVGRATHDARCSERAEVFATSLEARMTTIERAVAPLPRPRVLLAIDHEPLIAAGRGTFGDDLLRAAGAENIAAGALSSYPQLGLEGLLAGAPDVIVDAAMAPGPAEERAAAAEAFWSRWPEIPAVRGKRVFVVDPDLVVRPGPRLVDGLEAIARRLHPEAFPAR